MDFGFFQHDIERIKSFIQYFKKMSGYVVPSDPLSMLFNVSFTPHPPPPPSFIQLFNRKSFLPQLISHPAIPFPISLLNADLCQRFKILQNLLSLHNNSPDNSCGLDIHKKRPWVH